MKKGMLWAGTDDGKLWVAEDGGASWTDLTRSLPAAVKGQWLGRIEPSRHDARVAYLAVPAYRSQDLRPHLYRWQSVAGDLPAEAPVRVVPPGEYTVTLSYGKAREKQKLVVTVVEGIQTRYAPR